MRLRSWRSSQRLFCRFDFKYVDPDLDGVLRPFLRQLPTGSGQTPSSRASFAAAFASFMRRQAHSLAISHLPFSREVISRI